MLISRFLAAAIRRSVRPALSCRYLPRYHFSTTFQRAAVPSNLSAFQAAFQKTAIFKKLANHPEAISALQDLAKALDGAGRKFISIHEQTTYPSLAGVDVAGGKQPSTLQMIKLAANSELRAAVKRVAEEMKKADVDFGSKVQLFNYFLLRNVNLFIQEVMDELMNLKKTIPPK